MASILIKSILFFVLTLYVFGDEIELEVRSGSLLKMMRDMVNQTAADSMNLPSNATSIRENITDTFSCENRTYGYYADVDNECQIFHVCLPSQTASGRNVTYKWSFICPAETVFNQEVLVCTRERDSIPCEESPDFYDLNMEIGKIADPDIIKEEMETNQKETETVPLKKDNRRKQHTIHKKQNIIMEALMKDAEDQMEAIEDMIDGEKAEELPVEVDAAEEQEKEVEMNPLEVKVSDTNAESEFVDNERLGTERNFRTGRFSRGSMRFRADI